MAQATCHECASTFDARRKDSRFCSRSCSGKNQRRSNDRRCEVEGCDQPHGARGMCYSHYGTWHRQQNGRTRNGPYFSIVCIVCGAEHQASRRESKFCSDACKGRHYSETMRKKSTLPTDHPVMMLIEADRQAARLVAAERAKERDQARRSNFTWRIARECPGCACWFTPLYTPNAITCSKRCSRRTARWRRNAAERNAPGTFTWYQFMSIARRFDYCCAYCGERPSSLDPDHVVPLSRGGVNSTTNLLPSCRQCNGDKRDLLLSEWAADRQLRGKPPRFTSWPTEDRRYWHLTQTLLAAA